LKLVKNKAWVLLESDLCVNGSLFGITGINRKQFDFII